MPAESPHPGEERRLIFENLANGVPVDQVMATFRRSEAEVEREMAYVARKLREYRFRRALPPLPCGDLREIRFNRRALLENLRKLGPESLASDFAIPPVVVQQLDHPNMLQEAARRTGLARMTA